MTGNIMADRAATSELRRGHLTALELLHAHCPSGGLIVDAGAFPGTLTRAMHAAGYRVIALDKDPNRGLGIQGRYQTGQPVQADHERTYAEEMAALGVDSRAFDLEHGAFPVASHSVDALVMTEVIEHLYVDPLNALAEANRVLKPGGVLLVSTPNIRSIRRRLHFCFGQMDQVIQAPVLAFLSKRAIGHIGHVRIYAPEELRDMLAVLGFESAFTFCDFDFWDSAPCASVSDSGAAVVPTRRASRWRRSPKSYVQAGIATARDQLARRYPHLREHMFVIAKKTQDVNPADLDMADVRKRIAVER